MWVVKQKKNLQQQDRKSLPSDFEKDGETSHENEEEYLETIEYHSNTQYTMDMDQRESTDGCLKRDKVPIDGCSQLYVGDIEIRFKNFAASQISHEHKDEYHVSANEEPRSTSPSPLELQGVDQIQNEEEEEVHSHERSLNMSERDIQ